MSPSLLDVCVCMCVCVYVCVSDTSFLYILRLSRNNKRKPTQNVNGQWTVNGYRLKAAMEGLPDLPQKIAVQQSRGAPQKRCPDPP